MPSCSSGPAPDDIASRFPHITTVATRIEMDAVVAAMSEEAEEDSSSRDVTPDGGVFSGGASEASAASNAGEFEFSRPPLSGREGHASSRRAPVKKRQIAN